MIESIEMSKQILGLIMGILGLSAAIGAAAVSRYKIKIIEKSDEDKKKQIEDLEHQISKLNISIKQSDKNIENLEKEINKLELHIDNNVSKSEIKFMEEKIMNAEKTIEAVSREFQKQKDLFTEIRIEMGSMHTELKNINQLLIELKTCSIPAKKEV